MAFDDPIVWGLIIAAIVLLFGASRIPKLARSFGQARREFDKGSKGVPAEDNAAGAQGTTTTDSSTSADPLILAAQKEGIDTSGKTRDQIASELAWKLNKK